MIQSSWLMSYLVKWIICRKQVNAPFQVLQPSAATNVDTVFSCSHYHGVIPAESTIKLKVKIALFYILCWLSKNWGEMQPEKATAILWCTAGWCLRKESRKLWLFIQNWVLTHHQHGISALILQTSFWGEAVVASWNILPNTPSHWWFSKNFDIFSNFSHFTGVFYSSKSLLAVCGLSGHYGSWSYELLCHQVHWSGERWLSLCRVILTF